MRAAAPWLLYFDDEAAPAQRLADAAGLTARAIERHRFPDGEWRIRLPLDATGRLPARAVLLRSLHDPNDKLIALLLAARTARELGVEHLTLVAPYLAYMRQDMAFEPGQAVSQRIVGAWLAGLFDAAVTVDPHLHRVATLGEALPLAQPVVVSAAPALGRLAAAQRPGCVLVGPDGESAQWVAQAAAAAGLPHAVCTKERLGDREVRIALPPDVAVQGRPVVLLDDMASTGRTLALAARLLRQAGATSVDVAVTHALMGGDAWAQLQQAGIGTLWSTDCVPHASNAVCMAPDLAAALRSIGAA